jgi:quercetin dioxygenase-like cupin family protein
MKVIKIDDVEANETGEDNPLFTGGTVYAKFAINEKTAKDIHVGLITFSPGSRNVYHSHSSEQILYVTEGKGIVATEDEEVVVTPGTLIYFPPGEKHWHGATKDTSFAHIAIIGQPHEIKVLE